MLYPMSMQYRNMRLNLTKTLAVLPSGIQGHGKHHYIIISGFKITHFITGLFALARINPHEMVIEYAGEVIGQKMADSREIYYESIGRGCYMFRLDDDCIVDATCKGNQARFINHSCDPNCYAKIVSIYGNNNSSNPTDEETSFISTSNNSSGNLSPYTNFLSCKKVVIFAAKRIDKGTELTYDYQFPIEDDPARKVPCSCGAKNCRKYMN